MTTENEAWIEETSAKVRQWVKFNAEVMDHIEDYVIPQYGDYPDPAVEGWTQKDIKSFLEKYVQRIDAGARGRVEAERDCLKIAHYACYLYGKLKEGKDGMS